MRHHFTFSEEETRQLNELWQQRNRIVHHYFKERIHETFSPEGRSRMIKELEDFKDRAQELEIRLQQYTGAWIAELGLDAESAAALQTLERMHTESMQARALEEDGTTMMPVTGTRSLFLPTGSCKVTIIPTIQI
ncbi:hypothetical protein [Acinetobacter sp. VT 511]|uniref:hypothetical protein n=1 Tax=Acinetobacter sp. VT 511 TaxID=1675902 RepID=UPI00201E3FA2|nr:hypothetical protein [Acinetobacter sp. VT 511]